MLVNATESTIYMCGMAPLEPDDPFFDIFQCDLTFTCDSHIESEFFTSKIQPSRGNIYWHYAGKYDSPVELNTSLKAPDGPYVIVLPTRRINVPFRTDILREKREVELYA